MFWFSLESVCSGLWPDFPGWSSCWLALAVHYWGVCVAGLQMRWLTNIWSITLRQWLHRIVKSCPSTKVLYLPLKCVLQYPWGEKWFFRRGWWDVVVSVIHLTNEDSILVKRKPYPLPPVITVSMKSFPIIPLKTTPTSNMNYTPFHYEEHYIKHPIQ